MSCHLLCRFSDIVLETPACFYIVRLSQWSTTCTMIEPSDIYADSHMTPNQVTLTSFPGPSPCFIIHPHSDKT